MSPSTEAEVFHYGNFRVELRHAIGYFLFVQRKIQGYTQDKLAALTNYSRPYCSKLEIGNVEINSDFFCAYLKRLKLDLPYIVKFLKKVSRYMEHYFLRLKQYELIYHIASGKVKNVSKKLLQACRSCNKATLCYMFIRYIFKVYGLKPNHLGIVSAKGIKEKKNKKGPRERQAFEKSANIAKERFYQARLFNDMEAWSFFNNARCLFGRKLMAALKLLTAEGLA